MVVMVVFTESSSGCGKAGLFHVEGEERAGGQDAKGRKGGINGEFKVVLEKLVAFHIDNDGRRVASSEEMEVLQKMREVFGSEEWAEVSGLQAQDRRKVSKRGDGFGWADA